MNNLPKDYLPLEQAIGWTKAEIAMVVAELEERELLEKLRLEKKLEVETILHQYVDSHGEEDEMEDKLRELEESEEYDS
jgi:hypothetical protein